MKDEILGLAGLCMLAALCEQLLCERRLFSAIRMLIGMEIVWIAVGWVEANVF